MKKLILFLLPVVIFSCKNAESSSAVTEEQTGTFDWLTGDWQRLYEQDDRETFESWTKIDNSIYHGIGYTLQNRDTIWKETIKLVERDDWNFEVTGKGESNPTVFKLTNLEKEQFTCENPENEFPKLIHYYKDGDKLMATISDGEMEIPFEFERIWP